MKHGTPSLRKAAILIASLDERTAETLLAQMGPTQAQRVRKAVADLEDVDPREQSDVVEEFRRVGPLMPDQSPPGLELDTRLTRRLAQSQAASASHATDEPPASDAQPFRFLHEAQAQSLIPLLEREHPQTIAVVVSHLPPPRAIDVLSRLPSALQGEVIRRLGDLDEADPEILREVEQGLEKFVSEQLRGHRRRAAGLETVAAILEAADDKTRQEILSNLAGLDLSLARRLGGDRMIGARAVAATPESTRQGPMHSANSAARPGDAMAGFAGAPLDRPQCTFEDLVARKDAVVVAVLRAAGTELSALALAGATPQLVERVAARLGRREVRVLRKALANLGPTRLSDVERAQQELANLSTTFDDKGRRIAAAKSQLSAVA